jgi:hypothetical protein
MTAMVLDPKFRAVSVTEHKVSFKMRTVTSQTAAHEECELVLRLQLLRKRSHCVKGIKDM